MSYDLNPRLLDTSVKTARSQNARSYKSYLHNNILNLKPISPGDVESVCYILTRRVAIIIRVKFEYILRKCGKRSCRSIYYTSVRLNLGTKLYGILTVDRETRSHHHKQ